MIKINILLGGGSSIVFNNELAASSFKWSTPSKMTNLSFSPKDLRLNSCFISRIWSIVIKFPSGETSKRLGWTPLKIFLQSWHWPQPKCSQMTAAAR